MGFVEHCLVRLVRHHYIERIEVALGQRVPVWAAPCTAFWFLLKRWLEAEEQCVGRPFHIDPLGEGFVDVLVIFRRTAPEGRP